MRPFVRSLLPYAVAALLSGGAAAQSSSPPGSTPEESLEAAAADVLIADAAGVTEPPEELTVRGQRDAVGRYRMEMVKAREGLVETFNELNDKEENEITCKNEAATGTRMTQNVCRSKAENDASARAAKGFLDGLLRSAGRYVPEAGGASTVTQVNGQIGTSNSQREGIAGEDAAKAQLEEELRKLMGENRVFYRAVVKYVEAKNDYNEARGQGAIVETDPLPEGSR
jgi:hypothetical protein